MVLVILLGSPRCVQTHLSDASLLMRFTVLRRDGKVKQFSR